MRKIVSDPQLPYDLIPPSILKMAVENLKTYGVKKDGPINHDLVVTSFKSQISPNSIVSGVPHIVWFESTPTFRIPLRGRKRRGFLSLEHIRELM